MEIAKERVWYMYHMLFIYIQSMCVYKQYIVNSLSALRKVTVDDHILKNTCNLFNNIFEKLCMCPFYKPIPYNKKVR